MIKSAKSKRFLYLMNCIKIVSFFMRKNMFKRQKRKSLYCGKSNKDVRKQNNKNPIIKILQLGIQGIVRRGKMSKEESGLEENVSSLVAHTILTKKKEILSLLEEEGEI